MPGDLFEEFLTDLAKVIDDYNAGEISLYVAGERLDKAGWLNADKEHQS